jgi:lipoprotein Spr
MRRHLFFFTTACILLFTLQSCHTHKKYAANKSSKKPKFINDVYINGHNKSSTTKNSIAVAPAKKSPKKTRSGSVNADHTDSDQAEKATLEPSALKRKYADILGIRPKEIDNFSLYQFIDRWYGTNYRLGGQNKDGIDCSGFAQKLYGEVYGIDLLRTAMEQFGSCKRIKNPKDAEEGDLVFFHIRSKRITHVGVYLANNYFIHSSTSGGVIISSLNEEYWHKYFAGMGRVPKG